MRVAVDSNVLGYAEGLDDPSRQARADEVISALAEHELAMPLQVAAELHRLLMRRRRISSQEAGEAVARWMSFMPLHPATTPETFATALALSAAHRLQIFDSIILAASADAGCRMLLSEDMQDGFVWRGVTVVNPFAATPHPMLADLLRP